MSSGDLITRSWNGQAIRMRHNRICLTDLCKAGETRSGNPLRFASWLESEVAQRFLQHRSSETGRPILAISPVIHDGDDSALIIRESQRGDAWGDKAVAMHLAAQTSVELGHMIYSWLHQDESSARANQRLGTKPAASGEERQSYLYVMQRADTALVKIGFSRSPEKRKSTIESASGSPVLLLGVVPLADPATAEKSLHDELNSYRKHGEWFDLPASKLLGLITALSAQKGFRKIHEPFVPATLMRTVEDIQILACAGLLPVALNPDTGEHEIQEYKDYDHLVVLLAGPKNEPNAFSASVAYDNDRQFIPHSWRLCESYSGSMSNKYHPMLDVRTLMDAEQFFDFKPAPETGAS